MKLSAKHRVSGGLVILALLATMLVIAIVAAVPAGRSGVSVKTAVRSSRARTARSLVPLSSPGSTQSASSLNWTLSQTPSYGPSNTESQTPCHAGPIDNIRETFNAHCGLLGAASNPDLTFKHVGDSATWSFTLTNDADSDRGASLIVNPQCGTEPAAPGPGMPATQVPIQVTNSPVSFGTVSQGSSSTVSVTATVTAALPPSWACNITGFVHFAGGWTDDQALMWHVQLTNA